MPISSVRETAELEKQRIRKQVAYEIAQASRIALPINKCNYSEILPAFTREPNTYFARGIGHGGSAATQSRDRVTDTGTEPSVAPSR